MRKPPETSYAWHRRTPAAAVAAALVIALAWCSPAPAEEPASETEAAIDRDRAASRRYIGIRLKREELLLKRGSDDAALKLEADCLRHEIKSLERYVWYLKRDRKLAGKTKALVTALDDLKKKDAKSSLEDRRKAGFKIADLVANPLGAKEAPPEPEPKETGRTVEGPTSGLVPNKPDRAVHLEGHGRFDGVKPPPGSETPPEAPAPDAGSAGSGGSGSDHR